MKFDPNAKDPVKLQWRAADLFGAVAWMAGKTLDEGADFDVILPGDCEGGSAVSTARFADGSCCVAESQCNGPYSDVTPDLDWEPPRFWLGEPERG